MREWEWGLETRGQGGQGLETCSSTSELDSSTSELRSSTSELRSSTSDTQNPQSPVPTLYSPTYANKSSFSPFYLHRLDINRNPV
ncbi:hypothetical protein [Nostoc sp.]|uniref:hypothetical protein n=1 Tax=Nostoc sp. TaxID=1180 RepID=UPI002FF8B764